LYFENENSPIPDQGWAKYFEKVFQILGKILEQKSISKYFKNTFFQKIAKYFQNTFENTFQNTFCSTYMLSNECELRKVALHIMWSAFRTTIVMYLPTQHHNWQHHIISA
jgi:hypothetical protein